MLLNAVKPNHELQYGIGSNFCLEDPTSFFQLMINCSLIQDPQPPPEFRWTLTYNSTNLSLNSEDNIMYHHGLSVYQENETLTLNGALLDGLDGDLRIYITCNVSNIYGNDSRSTSISLCGKLNAMLDDPANMII